ncbi:UNVERIFIED_CONTAM: hypothetical protein K2H54_024230 [Gekko kuhli]
MCAGPTKFKPGCIQLREQMCSLGVQLKSQARCGFALQGTLGDVFCVGFSEISNKRLHIPREAPFPLDSLWFCFPKSSGERFFVLRLLEVLKPHFPGFFVEETSSVVQETSLTWILKYIMWMFLTNRENSTGSLFLKLFVM